MSNFFGATGSGSGSNANKSSSNSGSGSGSGGVAGWGSFLKQGLSTIESKLDMVLDIQVPIHGGASGTLTSFSPHATVLPSSVTGATGARDTLPKRQSSLQLPGKSQDGINDSTLKRLSSDSSRDQDPLKTTGVTNARRSTDSSLGDRGKEEASVTVDPYTGMITTTLGTKYVSTPPVSGNSSGSNETSAASTAAAAAAAANRERLEQRMRGIFKKPTESPPSTPPLSTVVTRSTRVSPSPSARQSISIEPTDKVSTPSTTEGAELGTAVDSEANQTDKPKDLSASESVSQQDGPEEKSLEEPSAAESAPVDNEAKVTGSDTKLDVKDTNQEAKAHDDIKETDSQLVPESQSDGNQEAESNEQSASKPASVEVVEGGDNPVIEPEVIKTADIQTLPAELEASPEETEVETSLSPQQAQEDTISSKAMDSLDAIANSTSLDAEQANVVSDAPAPDQLSTLNDTTEVVPPVVKSKDIDVLPTTSDGTSKESTALESATLDENPLKRVVEQREEQLFKVMQEQSSLLERLRELEEAKAAEDALTITKIAGLEMIIESQKKELEVARESNLASQPKPIQKTLEEQRALLEEKDEQIRGLLAEGKCNDESVTGMFFFQTCEVLSKKEFKHLTTIKTLRMKSIEGEKLQMDTQKKLDRAVADYTDAQTKLVKLMDENKQLNDSVKSLHDINQRQNKQLAKVEAELAHLKEERVSLQSVLDRARQEAEEARKVSAELSSQAHAAALEREVKLNEGLNNEIESLKAQHAAIELNLRQDIQELRVSLSNRDQLAGEKEDQLLMEIRSLQAQLERNDNDSYELQEALDEARRPLLRQIEALQNQQGVANRNWERAEKNLTHRVAEAEEDAAKAQERERAARDKLDELKTHGITLESQIEALRLAETQLRSEINASKRIAKEKEEEVRQAQSELARERVARERTIEEAKEDAERKLRLQLQGEMDKLKQQIKQLQQQRYPVSEDNPEGNLTTGVAGMARQPSSSPSPLLSSGQPVVGGPKAPNTQGNIRTSLDSITSPTLQDGFPPLMSRSSSSQTMSGTGPTTPSGGLMNLGSNATGQAVAIERLNSVVRQLEGQVTFLTEQVRSANKNKDELSDELVRVTMELEDMQKQTSRVSGVEQELSLLQQRHRAALEMLGEKTEEVQELRADLQDVKQAYRDQINDLLARLESKRAG
ncbi:hypothetical protein BGX34_009851 [Mortierella sp. NVP85]|nr:hypothetical protein BGX34_009851 [Mortierella sp. NVP85]